MERCPSWWALPPLVQPHQVSFQGKRALQNAIFGSPCLPLPQSGHLPSCTLPPADHWLTMTSQARCSSFVKDSFNKALKAKIIGHLRRLLSSVFIFLIHKRFLRRKGGGKQAPYKVGTCCCSHQVLAVLSYLKKEKGDFGQEPICPQSLVHACHSRRRLRGVEQLTTIWQALQAELKEAWLS